MSYVNETSQLIKENFNISDNKTRKWLISLTEAEQNQMLAALSSALYDKIVEKVADIDFGTIPMSRGDITKVQGFDSTMDCLNIMKKIVIEYKEKTDIVDNVIGAVNNVRELKPLFMKGFALGIELPMMLYNLIVLSIEQSVSLMITMCIQYIKDPSSQDIVSALDKAAYNNTRENLMYEQLITFNASCASKEMENTLREVLKNGGAARESADINIDEVAWNSEFRRGNKIAKDEAKAIKQANINNKKIDDLNKKQSEVTKNNEREIEKAQNQSKKMAAQAKTANIGNTVTSSNSNDKEDKLNESISNTISSSDNQNDNVDIENIPSDNSSDNSNRPDTDTQEPINTTLSTTDSDNSAPASGAEDECGGNNVNCCSPFDTDNNVEAPSAGYNIPYDTRDSDDNDELSYVMPINGGGSEEDNNDGSVEEVGILGVLGIVGGVAAGAVIGIKVVKFLLKNFIPMLRNIAYFVTHTITSFSDSLAVQAHFVEMNAYKLQYSTTSELDDKKKAKVVAKQLKIAEKLKKWANRLAIDTKKAEKATKEEIRKDEREKLTVDNYKDTVGSIF